MSNTGRDLPSFKKPPVLEVAVGIQFEPIKDLRNPYLGVLWERYRDKLPKLEEHYPRPPVPETFEPVSGRQRQVRLQVLDTPPVSRVWFMSKDGREFVQVQQDRFVFNWRRHSGEDEYPRYSYVRKRFVETLSVFEQFLAEQDLGRVVPNQSEVSYLNHISAGMGWRGFDSLDSVIPSWQPRYSEAFLPPAEEVRLAVRYGIASDDDQPLGRLHITAEPGYRPDGGAMLILHLTARGKPSAPTIGSAIDFLDTGRAWIVRGFAAFTSTEMHREWERANGS
ncbi:MAG: TIGR04255 family protein [Longimicrobiales bacterium]